MTYSLQKRKHHNSLAHYPLDYPGTLLNELLFTKIEDVNVGYTAEATLDVLRLVFEDHIISRIDFASDNPPVAATYGQSFKEYLS